MVRDRIAALSVSASFIYFYQFVSTRRSRRAKRIKTASVCVGAREFENRWVRVFRSRATPQGSTAIERATLASWLSRMKLRIGEDDRDKDRWEEPSGVKDDDKEERLLTRPRGLGHRLPVPFRPRIQPMGTFFSSFVVFSLSRSYCSW